MLLWRREYVRKGEPLRYSAYTAQGASRLDTHTRFTHSASVDTHTRFTHSASDSEDRAEQLAVEHGVRAGWVSLAACLLLATGRCLAAVGRGETSRPSVGRERQRVS